MTVDEVRGTEDINKRGGKADELREPQNITGKPKVEGDDPPADDADPPPKKTASGDEDDASTRARAIVTESATRVFRKEVQRFGEGGGEVRGRCRGLGRRPSRRSMPITTCS